MQPAPRLLEELVRRIVAAVHPLRIILFGSAARDEMGPDSDLDVLVVMPNGVHRRETAQLIYRHLLGLGFATDVVVVMQSDVQRYAPNLLYGSEGHQAGVGAQFIAPAHGLAPKQGAMNHAPPSAFGQKPNPLTQPGRGEYRGCGGGTARDRT